MVDDPLTEAEQLLLSYKRRGLLRTRGEKNADDARARGARSLLWADVPTNERMTEADFRRCIGARKASWLRRHVDRLARPRCQGAAFYEGFGKYGPCMVTPRDTAASFCALHQKRLGGDGAS